MRIPFTRRFAAVALAAGIIIAAGVVGIAQQVTRPSGPGTTAPDRGNSRFPSAETLPFPDAPQVLETREVSIRVVPFAAGLQDPWSLAFLPGGDILVTEKAGRLRIVRDGTLDPRPIPGVPAVHAVGQGGLLEVALHPQFAENRFVYLTYSKPGDRGAATALARGRFDGQALTDVRDLLVAENWGTGRVHFGSKLAFGPDGMLYMTLGERGERDKSQDLMLHNGKILRLRDDGSVPPDNPFVGRDDARPEIYTYGHRNVQGIAFDPAGNLWATEHGPQGGDELNVIVAGRNYGWPLVTYGREYTGEPIPRRPGDGDLEEPVVFWVPSIGMSGLALYTGDRFPTWKGSAFAGGLSGQHIQRVGFAEAGPVGRETLLDALKLPVRDVRQGPDGLLYVAVDGESSGLLRIEPAAAPDSGRLR